MNYDIKRVKIEDIERLNKSVTDHSLIIFDIKNGNGYHFTGFIKIHDSFDSRWKLAMSYTGEDDMPYSRAIDNIEQYVLVDPSTFFIVDDTKDKYRIEKDTLEKINITMVVHAIPDTEPVDLKCHFIGGNDSDSKYLAYGAYVKNIQAYVENQLCSRV